MLIFLQHWLIFFQRSCMTLLLICVSTPLYAAVVSYKFEINFKTVKFTDTPVRAMAINDSIPAPTITARVGDILRVTFYNKMDVSASIHWHGVLLPNEQDGVPYLTTPPIAAGSSHVFEFPIIHAGTYWYHSHTALQEQRGLYGALVFLPEKNPYTYHHDEVIVISDWTDEDPHSVLRNLKREDDYYALKKNTMQSWDKVIQHGPKAIKNRLRRARIRMDAMDISDVGYDAFLVNGQTEQHISSLKSGDVIRLRLVNAGASTYFFANFSGGEMTIIEADGLPVQPVNVNQLRLATAETYDVLVTLPNDKGSYELRINAEDGTGYASLFLGEGRKVYANDMQKPNLLLIDHTMHNNMDHSSNVATEYAKLRALQPTNLNLNNPLREVTLHLTGSMRRYTWSFNNKVLSEADNIRINKGENVRFRLVNETMMDHPLHLHGHFFRVLNGEGDYSPLKHTVSIPPMQTVTIEFFADQEKDWFFHCHNLYHMKSGMARVVSYNNHQNDTFNNYIKNNFDPWFTFSDLVLQSNMLAGRIWTMNTKNKLETHYDFDYKNEYDIEAIYERSLSHFFGIYIGNIFEQEDSKQNKDFILGISYVLPMNIDADIRFDTSSVLRFQVSNEHQLSNRVHFSWHWNTDQESRVVLSYAINKRISLLLNHDSDFDVGAGIEVHF